MTVPDAAPTPRTVRLAVGLGDAEREQRLFPMLDDGHGFRIAARCLTGEQLVEALRIGQADAVLVAGDLHRLDAEASSALARAEVPMVVLARDGLAGRLAAPGRPVLPLTAEPDAIREALLAAVNGARSNAPHAETAVAAEPSLNVPPPDISADAGVVLLAITGAYGSPGRTTVAINLAAGLGTLASTLLVDADLCAPSTVIQLDRDPTRNLYMLAHAEPQTVRDWDRAIEQETQPLAPGTGALVLCGVPKPEMRRAISARFLDRLLAELRARFRYVVFDMAQESTGTDSFVFGQVMGTTHQVLVVSGADLPSLARTRSLLRFLQGDLSLDAGRLALVLNRYDRRQHHSRAQIEWALGVGSAAVIPYDYQGVQRALAAQRPLVLDPHGRAAKALLDLAGRVHGGAIRLALEEPARRRRSTPRLRALRLAWRLPRRHGKNREEEHLDDGHR